MVNIFWIQMLRFTAVGYFMQLQKEECYFSFSISGKMLLKFSPGNGKPPNTSKTFEKCITQAWFTLILSSEPTLHTSFLVSAHIHCETAQNTQRPINNAVGHILSPAVYMILSSGSTMSLKSFFMSTTLCMNKYYSHDEATHSFCMWGTCILLIFSICTVCVTN